MRTASALFVARPTPKEPVKFQAILPLRLKQKVSGKGDKTSNVCCLHEMSVLLACFKTHDFNQNPCSKEMGAFQQCYLNHLDRTKMKKEKEARGELTPGEKKLSFKQLNILLGKFPNVK